MRLFFALFRRKNMPHGHIHRGKERLVKEVTREDLHKLRNEFEVEERNMFYLRHPYLSAEQSQGHAKALGKAEARIRTFNQANTEYYQNVTIESRLAHLRTKEPWD